MTDRSARPRVAVFRPDDGRLAAAATLLSELGVEAVCDPMLEIEASGEQPRTDGEYTVFTSKTGAELIGDLGWQADTTVCAIGDRTASALEAQGYGVEIVPRDFSSSGLVDVLGNRVAGARVEVARSDHGSSVLLDGLNAAGAYVHETVLYSLVRPPGSGQSATLAADRALAGAIFTSSLTVSNFLTAAREQGLEAEARAGLAEGVVGAIGEPTRETAEAAGIAVDVVPETADFETLARAVHTRIES